MKHPPPHPQDSDWTLLKMSVIIAIVSGGFTEIRELIRKRDVTVATSLIALLNIGTIGVLGGAVGWLATAWTPDVSPLVVYSMIAVLSAAGRDRVMDIVTRIILTIIPQPPNPLKGQKKD